MRQLLAYILCRLRLRAGLALEEAAHQAGIPVSLLADVEAAIWTDDFRVNELGAICRVYGVDALELMGWTKENLTNMILNM